MPTISIQRDSSNVIKDDDSHSFTLQESQNFVGDTDSKMLYR